MSNQQEEKVEQFQQQRGGRDTRAQAQQQDNQGEAKAEPEAKPDADMGKVINKFGNIIYTIFITKNIKINFLME